MLTRALFFMFWATTLSLCALASLMASPRHASAAELITIRSNFTFVTHTLNPPTATPPATASVLLLAGGNGVLKLDLSSGQVEALQGNFLIRSAYQFMNVGLNVAMLDAPGPYMTRLSASHAQYVAKAVAVTRKNWPKQKQVWLVGTSNGTISAFSLAARGALNAPPLALADFPDGIVLASPIVKSAGETVWGTTPPVAKAKLKIPVLVVSHASDPCINSDFDLSKNFYDAIISPKKEFFPVKGAMPAAAQWECDAFSYHGFHGVEEAVVKKVADFIP